MEVLTSNLTPIQARSNGHPDRTAPVERILSSVPAEVLQVEFVPADAHVFDDLGADSMLMARFCTRVRKRADLPSISIKDVYAHPTIANPAGTPPAAAPEPTATPVVEVATHRADAKTCAARVPEPSRAEREMIDS